MIYTPMTKKALVLMFEKHKNQVDKDGIPYVFHPYHVAEQMRDEESVIVALLHDIVEDTDVTFDDLEAEGFPEVVISTLKVLTRQKGETYRKYILRVKQDEIATKVKIADLLHNLDTDRCEDTYTLIERYQSALIILQDGWRFNEEDL